MKRSGSFRFRLTLLYALVLGLILGLFSLGVYLGLRNLLYHNLDTSLWSIAESEVASASDAPDEAIHFHDAVPDPFRNRNARVLDKLVQLRVLPDGRIIGKSHSLGIGELPLNPQTRTQLLKREIIFETVRTADSPPIRIISLPIIVHGEVRYVMQVGASLLSLHTTLNRLLGVLLVMDGIALLLTGAGGALLAHRAVEPIDRLTRAIERIAGQNLHERLNITNPTDELGRLTRVLNHMLERLERSFRSQQRFIADASHELRSPLANLHLALELALRRQRPPDAYREALSNALEDVEHLETLTNDLLTLSQADSGRLHIAPKPVALQPLLCGLLDTYQARAQARHLTLTCTVPEVTIEGDEMRLRQLFANLVDNALQYTPRKGLISLSGTQQGNKVHISVRDTGIGIAPQHLTHIFERFYRVDKERSRAEGGGGLGLSICQEIAQAHGGTLHVESRLGQGSTFTVILPQTSQYEKPAS